MRRPLLAAFCSLLVMAGACHARPASAADLDEFKAKRQEVFEFTEKPSVTRNGDTVTITFTRKGYSDATAAVENAEGKIIRHLASGVLGPNAPEPFQKNVLKQTVVWDGKDDRGVYVDDEDSLTVRVSLGLEARYEKSLFWEPKKSPSYVATLSDRYLYIGDVGNARIVQVKLGYHAEEKVALKDAADQAGK